MVKPPTTFGIDYPSTLSILYERGAHEGNDVSVCTGQEVLDAPIIDDQPTPFVFFG